METQDSGKRAIRMTEKGMEGHKARQVQARRYKLSQFTTTVKQTEQLMEDGANVNIVTDKLRVAFSHLQQEFSDLNFGLQRLATEEEFEVDQRCWFDPKNQAMNDFFWKCEEWMKGVMKRTEQAEQHDTSGLHAESRSTSSKSTTKRLSRPGSQNGCMSSSSSSSGRVKAEMGIFNGKGCCFKGEVGLRKGRS